MNTKNWVIKIEIAIDEDSHPRKFIPNAIAECLNFGDGEDIIDYEFICLDWSWKTTKLQLIPMMDVGPFGMRNPVQRKHLQLYAIVCVCNCKD